VGLATQLHPIIERYRDSDVVFLSINTDKSKKLFLDGVKSGLYGGAGVQFGWTGALALFHPMLQYYNFTSFPQAIVINKQGVIVSVNPPRGYDDVTTKEWYALLDKALK